jgi:hypothetical protein
VSLTAQKVDKPGTRSRRHLRSSNKSGLRGVHKHGKHGWRVLICVRGCLQHIGTFPTKQAAAEAYGLAVAYRAAEKLQRTKAEVLRRIQDLAPSGSLFHGQGGMQ